MKKVFLFGIACAMLLRSADAEVSNGGSQDTGTDTAGEQLAGQSNEDTQSERVNGEDESREVTTEKETETVKETEKVSAE